MKILHHYFDINQFPPPCKEAYDANQKAVEDALVGAKFHCWKIACPEEYHDTDPDLIQHSRLSSLFADESKGCYIYGDAGKGKTRAAICLLAKNYMEGKSVKFLSQEQFFVGAMKIADVDENGKSITDRLSECNVLLIDDLFKRKITEAQEFFLYCILERRMNKRTIITSNIPFSKIPNLFTEKGEWNTFEPIMRRIKETSRIIKFS